MLSLILGYSLASSHITLFGRMPWLAVCGVCAAWGKCTQHCPRVVGDECLFKENTTNSQVRKFCSQLSLQYERSHRKWRSSGVHCRFSHPKAAHRPGLDSTRIRAAIPKTGSIRNSLKSAQTQAMISSGSCMRWVRMCLSSAKVIGWRHFTR